MKVFGAIGLLLCSINVAFGADTFCTFFNTSTCVLSNANAKTTSESLFDSSNTNIVFVVMDSLASEFILQSVFDRFRSLKVLEIPFGNIKNLLENHGTLRIGTGTSSDLTLERLQIKNSEFKKLSTKAFEKCVLLTDLDLSHNQIATFDSEFDISLDKLVSLNLAFNKITSLFTTSTKLVKLEVFNVSGNALTTATIPAESVLLKRIDFSRNKISSIPKDHFKLYPNLQEIQLGENSITTVESDVLSSLGSLIILNVGDNPLTSLEFLIKATKLKTLNISSTAITQLSDKTLEAITDLEYLYLSHNKITYLPTSALKKNTKLVLLDVSGNRINKIDSSESFLFDTLSSIKFANFSCNQCISENFAKKPTAEDMKACNSSPSIIISTALTFIFVAITKML